MQKQHQRKRKRSSFTQRAWFSDTWTWRRVMQAATDEWADRWRNESMSRWANWWWEAAAGASEQEYLETWLTFSRHGGRFSTKSPNSQTQFWMKLTLETSWKTTTQACQTNQVHARSQITNSFCRSTDPPRKVDEAVQQRRANVAVHKRCRPRLS